MEFFQIIGSIFQTPSPLPMAGGKGASVPGSKPEEGFLSGMFTVDGRSCDSKLSKDNIGSPCNFKHVAHIGWNSRFNCTVNSDLQLIFRKAGIGEEHLKDRRTSKKIFEIIERKGGMKAVREEAIGIDVPAESSSICSALQKLSAEISEQPMETSVSTLISNKGTSNDTVLPSLPPPGNFAEAGFGPIRPQRRLRPFSRNTTKGLPPPLIHCTLVDSLHIPPPPPLPAFLHTSVVAAPVPLPSHLKYSAYDSTDHLPRPPPRVQFSRIQTSGLSAQTCMPPPLSNCMSVDSVISPPPPPLPPFLKKSIISVPVPEQPPNCFGMDAVSILPSPLLLPFNSHMAVASVPLQASQVQSVVQIDPCAVPPSNSSFQTVQLHPPSNFNTLQSPLPTKSPVPLISSPLPTGNVLAHDSKVPPGPLHPPKQERLTKHQQVGNLDSSSEMGNGKRIAFMEQPSLLDEIRKGIRLKSAHVDLMVADSVSEPISKNKGFGAALEEAVRHGPKALRNSYASAGLNPNGSTLENNSILDHPIGTPIHQAPPSNNCSSVPPPLLPSDGCAAVSVPIPPPPPLPSFLKTAIVSAPVTLPPPLNCRSVNSVALPLPPPAPPLPPSFKTNRSLVPPPMYDCNLLTDSNAVPPLPKCNNSSNTGMLVPPQLPCNVNASQSTLPTHPPVLVPSALPIPNSLAPNSMLPPAAPIPTKPARPNKPRSVGSLMNSRETNIEKQTPPKEQPNLMDEIRKGIHLKSTVMKLKVTSMKMAETGKINV
ncbi:uncharacterized protein [Ambystoma mexicanum]|uniref:uncharacterized protein isoform X2 n=1 Tax=Ambystoma mexicanum TaxID=8296 RepID=UPI0037E722F0